MRLNKIFGALAAASLLLSAAMPTQIQAKKSNSNQPTEQTQSKSRESHKSRNASQKEKNDSSSKSKKSKSSDGKASAKDQKSSADKSSRKSSASARKDNAQNNAPAKQSSAKKTNQSAADSKRAAAEADNTPKKELKNKKPEAAPAPERKPESPAQTSRFTDASAPAPERASIDSITTAVNNAILKALPSDLRGNSLRVNSVSISDRGRKVEVKLNEQFTYLPITQHLISDLTQATKKALPEDVRDYRIDLLAEGHPLSYYVSTISKLPESARKNPPFVVATEPFTHPTKGMENDIIALWHSHGRYFKNGGWAWQRPVLFETLEDIYTMSYILPFVTPMLENAGAYVMLPRERDTNPHEVIVDNDTNVGGNLYSQPYYKEHTGSRNWETGQGDGFIYDLATFRDTENPFEQGTYRQTKTVKSGKPSVAAWYADIPEDGEYAIYVSYKSLPNSTTDARYTVNYSGGSKEFTVNQTMGGGTWIYLGTFPLEEGYSDVEPVVTLTNISDTADKIVTADAIKIGGGMGNIERSTSRRDVSSSGTVYDSDDFDGTDDSEDAEGYQYAADKNPTAPKGSTPKFSTSGLPRFLEGARYWLHWAGIPESVYSPFHGGDDYKDDYTSRGHWVNYLAGGSRVLPGKPGLKIPVDVSMALHSDAGKRSDDSIVGTLGIYYTNGGKSYADGTPRMNSRILTDRLMTQITNDIRKTYEPKWTRRSMWDKSYLEARVAEVPTALIELMSHQNFGDMQYGLDPTFRFTVSRAIYKAIGRFVAERKGREFVVQPLPVQNFAIERKAKSHYVLTWAPTPDKLEPSAMPNKYIILERSQGVLGFRKIAETKNPRYEVKINDHDIHSFQIIAANDGGVSFPSETLAMREGTDDKAPVLIINDFTRVSAPGWFSENGRAGFDSKNDFGSPYIKDISFAGHQTEFRRSSGDAFGKGDRDYINTVIAGNTFDFPLVHGLSIAAAGYGFVSCSAGAVENGTVALTKYKIVDIILGKQKTTTVGKGSIGYRFHTFPPALQKALRAYVVKGGSLMVSGQYIASDLYGPRASQADKDFADEVLGIEPVDGASATRSGKVRSTVSSSPGVRERTLSYSNTLNSKQYIVEKPDALRSTGAGAQVLLEFTDTDLPAGFLFKEGGSKRAVMSIPFESLTDRQARDTLMKEILNYLK